MKKLEILFFVSCGVLLLTEELIKCISFLISLFLLVLVCQFLMGYISRNLAKRRFKKQCDELFTEEFYHRLSNVIKDEFK